MSETTRSAPRREQQTARPIEPEIVESLPIGFEREADQSLPLVLRNRLLNDALIRDPMEQFEQQAALLAKLRPAAVKQTVAADWVSMGGEKVYLQASGCEKFTGLFGLVFGHKHVWREDHPDGTFSYLCTMPVLSTVTRVYYDSITGGRWSGEGFFQKKDSQDNPLPVNPIDLRKAAITNCEVRAVSKIAGLRNLQTSDLEKLAGFSAGSKIVYREGGKGGTSKARQGVYNDDGEPIISFGKQQGTPLTDLTEEQLDWHTKNAAKQLANPDYMTGGKFFKYRSEKEEIHKNLMAEIHRRLDADTGAEA